MKTRSGWVANSSSSSFVVISDECQDPPKFHDAYRQHNYINIPQTFKGDYVFETSGGTMGDYDDGSVVYDEFADRLNFAALVAFYKEGPSGYDMSDTQYTDMLSTVLQEDFGVKGIKINFRHYEDETHSAYDDEKLVFEDFFIPHQSHPAHDEDSRSMFKDVDTLRRWLYSDKSHVRVRYD